MGHKQETLRLIFPELNNISSSKYDEENALERTRHEYIVSSGCKADYTDECNNRGSFSLKPGNNKSATEILKSM
jgi:hypothetical protein